MFDRTFDPGTGIEGLGDSPAIRCMQVEPDGNILIGGEFNLVGGSPRSGVARLIGTNLPVTEIRRPPAVRFQTQDAFITEGSILVMTNWYLNVPDSATGSLTFSLSSGAPGGMRIDAQT